MSAGIGGCNKGFTLLEILLAMFIFTIPLAVGLVYEWMKGGLDW